LTGLVPAINAAAVGPSQKFGKTLERQILQIATRKTPIISTPPQSADQAFPKLFLAGSSDINGLQAKKIRRVSSCKPLSAETDFESEYLEWTLCQDLFLFCLRRRSLGFARRRKRRRLWVMKTAEPLIVAEFRAARREAYAIKSATALIVGA
jgi:hypothetical protein